jgi:hypothetical protein
MKNVSIVVCFEGKNRRVEINPKKCVTNPNRDFSCSMRYQADNGKMYMMHICSIVGTRGTRANVKVTNMNGKKVIAERQDLPVRFAQYIFK